LSALRRLHFLTWPWRSRRRAMITTLVILAAAATWMSWPRGPGCPVVATLKFPGTPGDFYTPWPVAFSPDGSTLVASGRDDGIVLWDLKTRGMRAAFPGAWRCNEDAVFSSDGRQLATLGEISGCDMPTPSRVTLIDPVHGIQCGTFELDPKVLNMRFPDTGSELELVTHDWNVTTATSGAFEIQSWDTTTGTLRSARPVRGPQAYWGVVSRDGRKMAAYKAPPPYAFVVWDLTTNPPTGKTLMHGSAPFAPKRFQFSPDGSILAGSRDDGSIELWDLSTYKIRSVLRGHSGPYRPGMTDE
jgi:WD40 repeat protein